MTGGGLSDLTSITIEEIGIGVDPGRSGRYHKRDALEKEMRSNQNACIVPESPDGEIGRRSGLKIRRPQGRGGSSPPPGTIKSIGYSSYALIERGTNFGPAGSEPIVS
jgi:hypothetical protein